MHGWVSHSRGKRPGPAWEPASATSWRVPLLYTSHLASGALGLRISSENLSLVLLYLRNKSAGISAPESGAPWIVQ